MSFIIKEATAPSGVSGVPVRAVGLSIARLQLLGLLLTLVALASFVGLTLQRSTAAGALLQAVSGAGTQRGQALRGMERHAHAFASGLRDMAGAPVDQLPTQLARLRQALQGYRADAARMAPLIGDAIGRQRWDVAQRAGAKVTEILDLARREAGERGEGAVAFNVRILMAGDHRGWQARLQAWEGALTALAAWDDAQAAQRADEAARLMASTRLVLVGGALLMLLINVCTGLWLRRHVHTGLQAALQAMRRIGRHDLSQPVPVQRGDEIGELLASLEEMRAKLHALVTGVTRAADAVVDAGGTIQRVGDHLLERTDQARRRLAETHDTIAVLSTSVEATGHRAADGQGLADAACQISDEGDRRMHDAVAAMQRLEASSQGIGDIIALIDSLAFQTNLVALNASVESARAGALGRGFAVVAGEVQTLAQRSVGSAGEIKALIGDARQQMQQGADAVKGAGRATEAVRAVVGDVSGHMAAIAEAARAQLQAIQRTRSALGVLTGVGQENAAAAREAAQAARHLTDEAGQLRALVAVFKLR